MYSGAGILIVDVDADAVGDLWVQGREMAGVTLGEASWSALVNAAAIIALIDSHLGMFWLFLFEFNTKVLSVYLGTGIDYFVKYQDDEAQPAMAL